MEALRQRLEDLLRELAMAQLAAKTAKEVHAKVVARGMAQLSEAKLRHQKHTAELVAAFEEGRKRLDGQHMAEMVQERSRHKVERQQLDESGTSLAQTRQVTDKSLLDAHDKLEEMAASVEALEEQLSAALSQYVAKCDRHGEEVGRILERNLAERAELVAGFEEEKAGLERQLDQALFDPAKAALGQESLHLREKLRSCEIEMEEAVAERARQKEEERELLSAARGETEQLRSTVSSLDEQIRAAHSQHAEQCDRYLQELGGSVEESKADRAARDGEVAPLSLSRSPSLSPFFSVSTLSPPPLLSPSFSVSTLLSLVTPLMSRTSPAGCPLPPSLSPSVSLSLSTLFHPPPAGAGAGGDPRTDL
jgi:chromosome segregation ATPase